MATEWTESALHHDFMDHCFILAIPDTKALELEGHAKALLHKVQQFFSGPFFLWEQGKCIPFLPQAESVNISHRDSHTKWKHEHFHQCCLLDYIFPYYLPSPWLLPSKTGLDDYPTVEKQLSEFSSSSNVIWVGTPPAWALEFPP